MNTKLNNGVLIPKIGIGTYMLSPEEAQNSVREALMMGYRLVDTANSYVNEKSVGVGIVESGVPREQVFVSTKIWPSEYENEKAIDETLERLGLDYIDLLFLHQPAGNWQKAYKMLEKAYKEGKIRAIGISNFEGEYLEELLDMCEIIPQVIQVECHPYFAQDKLRDITEINDIKLMSWYPLGHGDRKLLEEPIITDIAKKYNKTPAQVILRWHIDMGFIVIPGSKNVEHIKENFNIFDFELVEENLVQMHNLDKGLRYYNSSKEILEKYVSWKPTYEK